MRHSLCAVILFAVCVATAGAQSSVPSPANDSIFRRARRLVSEGNGAAGRALVDSILSKEREGQTSFGNALYWRGALAQTAADAERDYRRVIVEYPLSAYADDALLAMAELEQARGDRAGALQHLQRFVREHPVSTARGTAAFAGARLAFELGDTRAACSLLSDAQASVASGEVELRNQVEYYASRCPTNASAPARPATAGPPSSLTRQPKVTVPVTPPAKIAPAVPPSQPVPQPTVRQPAESVIVPIISSTPVAPLNTLPAAPKSAEMFTVQLAAYNSLADATALVAKLETRGIHARISGTVKPFRVRLGLHATRQAALKEAADLKAKAIIGFVTTEEQTAERKRP